MRPILTIAGREDGFGAQYYACMTGVAQCRFWDYIYRHTPFKTLTHPYVTQEELGLTSNRSLCLGQIFAAKMNRFCGLQSDQDDSLSRPVDYRRGRLSHIEKARCPEAFFTGAVRQELRNFYFSTPKPEVPFYDVVIHIRRGDVTVCDYPHRYVPLEFYQHFIEDLTRENPSVSIGIYSDGTAAELFSLDTPNVTLELQGDPQRAFHALVAAPRLVITKSYFSFCAALLSSNQIYTLVGDCARDSSVRGDPYTSMLQPFKEWRNLKLDNYG